MESPLIKRLAAAYYNGTWSYANQPWRLKPEVHDILLQCDQECLGSVSERTMTHAQNHHKGVLDKLERLLKAKDTPVKFKRTGGSRHTTGCHNRNIIFNDLVMSTRRVQKSQIDDLTGQCLDPKAVIETFFQKIEAVVNDNDDLRYIVDVRCEGTTLWMHVFRFDEAHQKHTFYKMCMRPAVQVESHFYLPTGEESPGRAAWQRSVQVEERRVLERYKDICFVRSVRLSEAMFKRDRLLAKIIPCIKTATIGAFSESYLYWSQENNLAPCIGEVHMFLKTAIERGGLNHRITGEDLLAGLSEGQRADIRGRLDRIINNEQQFTSLLEEGDNHHMEPRERQIQREMPDYQVQWHSGVAVLAMVAAVICIMKVPNIFNKEGTAPKIPATQASPQFKQHEAAIKKSVNLNIHPEQMLKDEGNWKEEEDPDFDYAMAYYTGYRKLKRKYDAVDRAFHSALGFGLQEWDQRKDTLQANLCSAKSNPHTWILLVLTLVLIVMTIIFHKKNS